MTKNETTRILIRTRTQHLWRRTQAHKLLNNVCHKQHPHTFWFCFRIFCLQKKCIGDLTKCQILNLSSRQEERERERERARKRETERYVYIYIHTKIPRNTTTKPTLIHGVLFLKISSVPNLFFHVSPISVRRVLLVWAPQIEPLKKGSPLGGKIPLWKNHRKFFSYDQRVILLDKPFEIEGRALKHVVYFPKKKWVSSVSKKKIGWLRDMPFERRALIRVVCLQ